jgi:LmbE family N-acetylglucosaminyl deacetylase
MRAAQALARLRSFPLRPLDIAFPASRGAVSILAPHPDDESLGCGGLIASLCDRANPPVVVILTDGTGSHPNSKLYPPARLKTLREAETLAATARLGLPTDRLKFFGYRDTEAPGEGQALQQAASRLARLLRHAGCTTLLAPWRHDPHGDHEAAAMIAVAASRLVPLRLLAYPVWALTLAPDTTLPDDPLHGFRIEISGHLTAKRAAIHAHASQYAGLIQDDPDGFQMQPGFIDLFLQPTEIFVELPAAEGAWS